MNYLLIGREEYLKHQFVERLKKDLFDFDLFHAGTTDITKILDSLNTQPFVSKERLIVIKDIDGFTSREKGSILKYLKSPLRSTTLVLESTRDDLDKSLLEFLKFVKPIRCNRLKGRELDAWIKREFSIRKKRISPSSIDLMKEVCGDDLFLLKNEIEKIISFIGKEAEVTEDHIEVVLGRSTYKTVFDLLKLILEKNSEKILASLERFLAKEKPHQILSLLAWQFRNFDKMRNLPRRLEDSDLKKSLEIILEADVSIKRGTIDARHALERALLRLCSI